MGNLDYNQFQAYIDGLYADGTMSEQDYNDIILYILANGETEKKPRDLIQIRRGFEENLPTLAQGEMGFTLDSEKLFVGGLTGNVEIAKNKNFVNIKDFGAKGDGVTDDTISILEAIDKLPIEGGVVIVPNGNYKIKRHNETFGVTIANRKNIVIIGNGESRFFAEESLSGNIPFTMFLLQACENITFINLVMEVFLTGSVTERVNSSIVLATSSGGKGSKNINVYNSNFKITHTEGSSSLNALYGFYFSTQSLEEKILSKGFRFINNNFYQSEGRLVQVWCGEDVIISNNRFIECGPIKSSSVVRVLGGSKNIRILNNYIEDTPYGEDLIIMIAIGGESSDYGKNVIVKNNTMVSNRGTVGANSTVNAITILGVKDVIIEGNILEQLGTIANKGHGIRINKEENLPSTNVKISNNIIKGFTNFQVTNYDDSLIGGQLVNNCIGLASNGATQNIYDPNNKLDKINNFIESTNSIVSGIKNNKIGFTENLPISGYYVRGDILYNLLPVKGQNVGWVRLTTGENHILNIDWQPFGLIEQ